MVCDTYIPHEELRFYWNRLIIKKGYMKEYTEKYINLTMSEYIKAEFKEGKNNKEILKKRFLMGKASGWTNPNSTDIKAVKQVKNIASYIATYMSKKEEGKRKVNGRLWGCSYNLSSENKCVIELDGAESNRVLNEFDRNQFESKIIESKPDAFGKTFVIAELFFYKTSDFISKVKGTLKSAFIDHINAINDYKNLRNLFTVEEVENLIISSQQNRNTDATVQMQQKLFY